MPSFDYETGPDQIIKTFATLWADRTKVAYPRETFDPDAPDNKDKEFVRMTIRDDGTGGQVSIGDPGNNRHDRNGLITFGIFSPDNDAANVAAQRAKEIVNIYLNKRIDGILYLNPTADPKGTDPAGYWQINVLVQFTFEQNA